jgi:hypothetical protein
MSVLNWIAFPQNLFEPIRLNKHRMIGKCRDREQLEAQMLRVVATWTKAADGTGRTPLA